MTSETLTRGQVRSHNQASGHLPVVLGSYRHLGSVALVAGIGASAGLPRPVVGVIRSATLQRLPALEN
jgi:hypothetical protein